MADSSKSTPILLALIAGIIGYAGWSGDGINMVGVTGIRERMAAVDSTRDTLASMRAKVDAAKRQLGRENIDQVKERIVAYRAQLEVLRSLVPEQREVADLLDDIAIRAKAHGVTLSTAITPDQTTTGPGPFETYAYRMSVIGRYHQVGRFLTDVASLRRIVVTEDVAVAGAPMDRARVLGDTLGMLEVNFAVKTYVKPAGSGGGVDGAQ